MESSNKQPKQTQTDRQTDRELVIDFKLNASIVDGMSMVDNCQRAF